MRLSWPPRRGFVLALGAIAVLLIGVIVVWASDDGDSADGQASSTAADVPASAGDDAVATTAGDNDSVGGEPPASTAAGSTVGGSPGTASDGGPPPTTDGAPAPGGTAPSTVTDGAVALADDDTHGPLCDALPAGDDPGGPQVIADLPADEALTWIPVLTIFEAATRAAGLTEELREAEGVTILAPTDDAFGRVFTEETLDDLIIFRPDELRRLLESHLIGRAMTVAELVDAGTVTTLGGDRIVVAAAGAEARLADRAQTVCADYRVGNATIHVVDGVLGQLPAPAPPEDPVSG